MQVDLFQDEGPKGFALMVGHGGTAYINVVAGLQGMHIFLRPEEYASVAGEFRRIAGELQALAVERIPA